MAEAKRIRKSAYEDKLVIPLKRGTTYSDADGEWYAFSVVTDCARKVSHEMWNRTHSNYMRGKYFTKEMFGVVMINVTEPMNDTNCSVLISFSITK